MKPLTLPQRQCRGTPQPNFAIVKLRHFLGLRTTYLYFFFEENINNPRGDPGLPENLSANQGGSIWEVLEENKFEQGPVTASE